MSAKLDGFVSIMATGHPTGGSGGSGDGLTVAEVITLINDNAPSGTLTTAQLAAVNSVVNNDYLRVEDADDLYTPRKQVIVSCSMQSTNGWTGVTEATLASNFATNMSISGDQVVSAHKDGATLRIEVTCKDSNVASTQSAVQSTLTDAAAMSTVLGVSGVTASSTPVVTRSLLTSSTGKAILALV